VARVGEASAEIRNGWATPIRGMLDRWKHLSLIVCPIFGCPECVDR
jgi:hypothetical protein